jgi:hypothetical protein
MLATQFQRVGASFSENEVAAMTSYFEDHGLPLVQLKEQRRDLVVALMGRRSSPVSKEQIAEIAAIQQAIAAVETVIADLDAETYPVFPGKRLR